MFLASLTIENFRCFGDGANKFHTAFHPGLNALVGANDAGKTAVIDAIRFALGTSDQDRPRIEDSDFHADKKVARVVCCFAGLEAKEQKTFAEYLTHGAKPGEKPFLFVHWTVENSGEIRRGRPYRRMTWNSGKDGKGAEFNTDSRTYLREGDLVGLIRSGYVGTHRADSAWLGQVLERANRSNRGLVLAWQKRIKTVAQS